LECRIRVVSLGSHRAVLASERIGEGEVVLQVHGVLVGAPDRYSIQVGEDRHLAGPPGLPPEDRVAEYGWRFLNHSCDPNSVLRGHFLVARQEIQGGMEVTFDYNTTEWEMSHPFRCMCGAETCVGLVAGFRHLDDVTRARLLPWASDHLRAMI
jgi:hypothetical protein